MHRGPPTRFRLRPSELGCRDANVDAEVELRRGRGRAVDVQIVAGKQRYQFVGEDGLVEHVGMNVVPEWVDAVLDFAGVERAGVEQ